MAPTPARAMIQPEEGERLGEAADAGDRSGTRVSPAERRQRRAPAQPAGDRLRLASTATSAAAIRRSSSRAATVAMPGIRAPMTITYRRWVPPPAVAEN